MLNYINFILTYIKIYKINNMPTIDKIIFEPTVQRGGIKGGTRHGVNHTAMGGAPATAPAPAAAPALATPRRVAKFTKYDEMRETRNKGYINNDNINTENQKLQISIEKRKQDRNDWKAKPLEKITNALNKKREIINKKREIITKLLTPSIFPVYEYDISGNTILTNEKVSHNELFFCFRIYIFIFSAFFAVGVSMMLYYIVSGDKIPDDVAIWKAVSGGICFYIIVNFIFFHFRLKKTKVR